MATTEAMKTNLHAEYWLIVGCISHTPNLFQRKWRNRMVARGPHTNGGIPSGSFCPYINLQQEFRDLVIATVKLLVLLVLLLQSCMHAATLYRQVKHSCNGTAVTQWRPNCASIHSCMQRGWSGQSLSRSRLPKWLTDVSFHRLRLWLLSP